MNRILVKNISVFSLILGLILGIAAPVPYIGMIMLFGLLLGAAPVVMVYLIMAGGLELTTAKDSILTGALAGFAANLTFSGIYSVIMVILSKVFHYTPNFFLTAMIENSPIWLLLTFIIFLGVLCATTNAFSGFATFYIINLIRDIYEKEHPRGK